jgi:hypothetical protein
MGSIFGKSLSGTEVSTPVDHVLDVAAIDGGALHA